MRLHFPHAKSIMAEAVGPHMGIVASIGTLLQLSETVLEYIRNAVDAKDQMTKLLSEVETTKAVLEQLRETAKAPEWANTLESPEKNSGPFNLLKSSLQQIEA